MGTEASPEEILTRPPLPVCSGTAYLLVVVVICPLWWAIRHAANAELRMKYLRKESKDGHQPSAWYGVTSLMSRVHLMNPGMSPKQLTE